MAGWQEYLDMATKDAQVKSAGIFGQDGVTWAATDDLKPTPTEVRDVLAGVRDNGRLQQNGVVVGGTKYMFLASLPPQEPGLTGIAARKGTTSLAVIVTGKAVIVATTEEAVSNLTGPWFAARQLLKVGF